MKLIGICLIVFGVLALALGGFSYTSRERVVDLGSGAVSTALSRPVRSGLTVASLAST